MTPPAWKSVPCPTCGAPAKHPCVVGRYSLGLRGYFKQKHAALHAARKRAAAKGDGGGR